jgi:hypothetical protein
MGILVRLVASILGAVAGFLLGVMPAFGLALIARWWWVEHLKSVSQTYFGVLLLCVVIAFVSGCVSAASGYRRGLAIGREICAASGPEHHSRVDVNVSHNNKS